MTSKPQNDTIEPVVDPIAQLLAYLGTGEPLDTPKGKSEINKLVRRLLGSKACKRLFEIKEDHRLNGSNLIHSWEKGLLDLLCELPGLDGTEQVNYWLTVNTTRSGITSMTQDQGDADDLLPEAGGEKKKKKLSEYERFYELLMRVSRRTQSKKIPMHATIQWVSTYLKHNIDDLNEDDIPGCEALNIWFWAKTAESEYRKTYDAKRVPAKGFAADGDDGLVDDGRTVDAILTGIRKGVRERRQLKEGELSNVDISALRSLQEEPEDAACPDTISGVSELLEQVAQ